MINIADTYGHTGGFSPFRIFVTFVIIITAASATLWLCSCENKDNALDEISGMAISYADKIASPDNRYRELGDSISNAPNDSVLYRRLCRFSRSLFENGDQLLAFKYLKSCVSILNGKKDLSEEEANYRIYCLLLLGAAADEVGLRTISQGFYLEGLKAIDEYGLDERLGEFNNNIGVSLFKAGKHDEAEEYFEKAIQQGELSGNTHLLYIVYNNMSEIASENDDDEKALDLSLKAINHIDPRIHGSDYNSMLCTIGELYRRQGDLPMALTYMRNAYSNQKKNGNSQYLFDACIGMADVFKTMHMPDSTMEYLRMAESITASKNNPGHLQRLMMKKADIAYAEGDFKRACELERDIRNLKDSLYREECHARMVEANTIYGIGREAEHDRGGIADWNPVVVFSSMGCIVLALCAALIWIIAMKRKNDSLNLQKREAISQQAALKQRFLEKEIDRSNRIKEDLDLNHRKLASFTLSHIQTNQKVEQVETELKKMLIDTSQRDKTLRDRIKGMIAMLANVKVDAQWEEFQYYFDKVHPRFYSGLDTAHPGLTPKERRLCALISLGLSTKEIAGITFREVRSVETSRTRLRKKLGLNSEDHLFEHIKGFTRQQSLQ